jgi:hypothetical protein
MDEPPKVAIVFPYFRTRSPMEMLFPPWEPPASPPNCANSIFM